MFVRMFSLLCVIVPKPQQEAEEERRWEFCWHSPRQVCFCVIMSILMSPSRWSSGTQGISVEMLKISLKIVGHRWRVCLHVCERRHFCSRLCRNVDLNSSNSCSVHLIWPLRQLPLHKMKKELTDDDVMDAVDHFQKVQDADLDERDLYATVSTFLLRPCTCQSALVMAKNFFFKKATFTRE